MMPRPRLWLARRSTVRRLAMAFAVTLSLFPDRSESAPADFHTSFGTGGLKQVVFPGNEADTPRALATQTDGKTLIAGTCEVGVRTMVFVERLLVDGTLDPTFGDFGRVYTDVDYSPKSLAGVAVRSDGKIVVAGSDNAGFYVYLIRYNSDGTHDSSFSGDGVLVQPIPALLGYDFDTDGLVVRPDGRILISGEAWDVSIPGAVVVQFLEGGLLDPSFAGDGVAFAVPPFETSFSAVNDLVLQSDGSALLVGKARLVGLPKSTMFVARFTPAGVLDPSFEFDGYSFAIQPADHLTATAVAIEVSSFSPTKIVVAGTAGQDIALAKFNLDGTIDGSFGTFGIATYSANAGDDAATAVRIKTVGGEPNRIIVGGTGLTGGTDTQALIAQFFLGGTIDTAFDGDGVFHFPVSTFNDATIGIALSNSSILALAAVEDPANANTATIRVLANGGLDPGWDGDGVRIDDVGAKPSNATTFIHQPDGKILVGGTVEVGVAEEDGVIARLLSNGATDASFGVMGAVTLPQLASTRIEKLLLEPTGKVICVAEDAPPASRDFVLARLTTSGALDESFGFAGLIDYIRAGLDVVVGDAALDSSGRLLVVGTSLDGVGSTRLFLARFLPGGSVDATFGASGYGYIEQSLGSSTQNTAHAVALQSDGKILVAGVTDHGGSIGRQMTVARFDSNGFLDPTFDADGYTFVDFIFVNNSVGSAILVEPDGRIVVVGEASLGVTVCIARLLSNGALDPSFELDGMVVGGFTGRTGEGMVSLARRPNGGYLVCGNNHLSGTSVWALGADGSMATSYGPDGEASIVLSAWQNHLGNGVFNASGRIVLCGDERGIFSMVRLIGESVVTDAGSAGPNTLESLPHGLSLSAPSPNPARGTVSFTVASDAPRTIEVSVVDVAGRLLRRVEQRQFAKGRHLLSWDLLDETGRKVLPGVYFLRAFADGENRSQKILVAE